MEDLEGIWEKLNLNEDENASIDLQLEDSKKISSRGKCSLVGKVCSNRKIGREAVFSTIMKIWKVSKPPSFVEIRPNTFVITFVNQGDKRRILEGCPWLFDNHMFVLKLFDGMSQPNSINFDVALMWVQMHNMPLRCMTRQTGVLIGSSVGNVSEVDALEDDVRWGNYLRVKIDMDLRKVIARGRTVNLEGRKMWVPFAYEKLPKMCFKCGCILHGKMGCVGQGLKQSNTDERDNQFGLWLRASSGNRRSSTGGFKSKEPSTTGGGNEVWQQDNTVADGASVNPSQGKTLGEAGNRGVGNTLMGVGLETSIEFNQ